MDKLKPDEYQALVKEVAEIEKNGHQTNRCA